MLAKLNSFALVGIDALPVEVEVDVSAGLPKTVLVGLPEMAVKESIHRIERALANLGYDRHAGRTVINLAPADLRKDAGGFDLPIALGLLVATGQLLPDQLRRTGVGAVEDAERHGVLAEVGHVGVLADLQELHAVALSIQTVVAHQPRVPALAARIQVLDVGDRLHAISPNTYVTPPMAPAV